VSLEECVQALGDSVVALGQGGSSHHGASDGMAAVTCYVSIAQGTHTRCVREYRETQPELDGVGELLVAESLPLC